MPIALKVTFEDNTTQTVKAFNNAQVQSFDFTFAKIINIIIINVIVIVMIIHLQKLINILIK